MTHVQPRSDWHPGSWRARIASQQPNYPDAEAVDRVVARLSGMPPLVTTWEVDRLRTQIAEAAIGRRFLLQGGDCAEAFSECRPEVITNRLKVILQMSLVLIHGLGLPIIRVGRFAGQYAKPRSADSETIDGVSMPSYRGDIINGADANRASRTPDPERMVAAHANAALTLNLVRALVDGGFADLHHPENWNLGFIRADPLKEEYTQIVDAILHALRFMESVGGNVPSELNRVDMYTSHEALLLPFEEALTRRFRHRSGAYNLSTHYPWIGLRTADPEGAHIEYARGISNPIAIKIGPDSQPSDIRTLLRILDPHGTPGRLTLTTRMSADRIGDTLPRIIDAVRSEGKTVLWCCDPMHGNTETTESGVKTRRFDSVLSELEQAFDLHDSSGTSLGGVHLELTGEDVTECIGGASGVEESDLGRAYKSQVDPRLNAEQALEMAFSVVRKRGRPLRS